MSKLDDVANLIASKANILLTSHIRADGDGIGAQLALATALERMGKQAHIVNDGGVPEAYRFLPGSDRIDTQTGAVRSDYDLVIVLDAAELSRIGAVLDVLPAEAPLLNIDHHSSNGAFGALAWIDAEASSVGEMIYKLLRHMDVPITEDIAVSLYAAIATDTGRFLHSNTTADSLRIVADFLEAGFDLTQANNALYRSVSSGLLRLRTMALETISFSAEGRIATMHLTQRMFEETGTDPLDTQEFVEIPRSVKGVSVAVLLYELKNTSHTKVSFRANADVDVCAIAKRFGGGGHLRAAGCELDASIDEAHALVVEAVEAALCHPAR